jgi:hypothetical protein
LIQSKARNSNIQGSVDFSEVNELFYGPHYVDQRNDDPEQCRAIGWSMAELYTVIYEDRVDEEGEYRHLVTLWKSTTQEKVLYESQ